MFKWLKPEPVDWSDVDRLEQRIRDIRERIRRAKGPEKPILPSSRMDLQTPEQLRQSLAELRRSVSQGSTLPQKSPETTGLSEAEKLREKFARLRPRS